MRLSQHNSYHYHCCGDFCLEKVCSKKQKNFRYNTISEKIFSSSLGNSIGSAWNPGLKELNQEISHYKQSYQKIYVAEIPLAYSYFSVYQKFSPNDFQKNAQWKQEGFHEVEEFENFRFEPLPNFYQFSELNIPLYLHPGQTRILAVQAYNQELYQFVESQVVFQVKNFEGKTLWFAYEWTPQQLSEKIDTLWPKSKTKTSTLDYLQSLNSPADK